MLTGTQAAFMRSGIHLWLEVHLDLDAVECHECGMPELLETHFLTWHSTPI